MNLSEYDLNFVQHCLERGNEEEERIFKFFSYFIAVNYLYGNINNYRHKFDKELDLFIDFVQKFFPDKEAFECFNVFYNLKELLGKSSELLKKPVDNKTRIVNPITLFQNVYYVRCNLFHGSKHMHNERDNKLVDECNIILRTFLKCILEVSE